MAYWSAKSICMSTRWNRTTLSYSYTFIHRFCRHIKPSNMCARTALIRIITKNVSLFGSHSTPPSITVPKVNRRQRYASKVLYGRATSSPPSETLRAIVYGAMTSASKAMRTNIP